MTSHLWLSISVLNPFSLIGVSVVISGRLKAHVIREEMKHINPALYPAEIRLNPLVIREEMKRFEACNKTELQGLNPLVIREEMKLRGAL